VGGEIESDRGVGVWGAARGGGGVDKWAGRNCAGNALTWDGGVGETISRKGY